MKGQFENKVPVIPPIKSIEIKLDWTDGIGFAGKTFSNVHELADFLRQTQK